MSEINHFKKFVLCSGDMTANVDHLCQEILLRNLNDSSI
jgi:hypothetical protein